MAQEHREQDTITAKAMRDEAFRQRLLRDPKAALQEIGAAVPPGITVHVHEETDTDLHIIIPGAAPGGMRELSEAELELVAGGRPPSTSNCTSSCTCGSTTNQTITSLQKGCGCL